MVPCSGTLQDEIVFKRRHSAALISDLSAIPNRGPDPFLGSRRQICLVATVALRESATSDIVAAETHVPVDFMSLCWETAANDARLILKLQSR